MLCAFLKVFDKVNYWKLFSMLLDDDIVVEMVKLLAFWYSRQEMCVKWNSVIGYLNVLQLRMVGY